MATLPSGAPYMLGTDLNNTIDTYTLDNANYFDARVPLGFKTGTDSVSAPNVTGTNKTFTYPVAFPAGSTVVVLPNFSNSISAQLNIAITASSNTGFTWRVYHNIGSTTTINISFMAFRVA
jgi:hypothetical protein